MGKLIKISKTIRQSVERLTKLENRGDEKKGQILMFTGVRYERDEQIEQTSNKHRLLKNKKRHSQKRHSQKRLG